MVCVCFFVHVVMKGYLIKYTREWQCMWLHTSQSWQCETGNIRVQAASNMNQVTYNGGSSDLRWWVKWPTMVDQGSWEHEFSWYVKCFFWNVNEILYNCVSTGHLCNRGKCSTAHCWIESSQTGQQYMHGWTHSMVEEKIAIHQPNPSRQFWHICVTLCHKVIPIGTQYEACF